MGLLIMFGFYTLVFIGLGLNCLEENKNPGRGRPTKTHYRRKVK